MFRSLLCRLFGCSSNPRIYSAKIEINQGFDAPEPITDIPGWIVDKHRQTEIYEIHHNLGLTDPNRQLHIVATPMNIGTNLIVQSIDSNKFTISTWLPGPASTGSAFMFTAVHYP